MNDKVSVIVPTYNSEQYLEVCLQSILQQSHPHIELIVVDNYSIDATQKIAKKFTKKIFECGPERSAQRNYGVSQSTGSFVMIIDSDMKLTRDVIRNAFLQSKKYELKGVVIPEESYGTGFWAQCKKLERSFYIGVDWMEAARFYQRIVYDEMNGYDERVTGGEDYDLPQRIQNKYGSTSIGRIDDLIYHDEKKMRLYTLCKKKLYYGQHMNRYGSMPENVRNYKKQSSLLRRYGLFFSHPGKLYKNPLIGIGMLIMKTCEFGCGWCGLVSRKFVHKDYK